MELSFFRSYLKKGPYVVDPFNGVLPQSLRKIFYESQVNKGSTGDSELCLC